MGKEYATKGELMIIFVAALLFALIIGLFTYMGFEKLTLTQLAEAEGWEVECVNESQEYFILDLGCDEGKVVAGSPWIKLSEKCAKPLCYEYALRRYE